MIVCLITVIREGIYILTKCVIYDILAMKMIKVLVKRNR